MKKLRASISMVIVIALTSIIVLFLFFESIELIREKIKLYHYQNQEKLKTYFNLYLVKTKVNLLLWKFIVNYIAKELEFPPEVILNEFLQDQFLNIPLLDVKVIVPEFKIDKKIIDSDDRDQIANILIEEFSNQTIIVIIQYNGKKINYFLKLNAIKHFSSLFKSVKTNQD